MSIEAMNQALDALSGKIIVYSKKWREQRKAAITALRAAIEAEQKPEPQAQAAEPSEFESGKDVQIRRLESALASKEDEYQRLHAHCIAYKEAITKKNAALDACVEALEFFKAQATFGPSAELASAAIEQAKKARGV